MESQAHFFDIETLIRVNNLIWIVSKHKPSIPLLKLTQSEFNLIRKGIYRRHDSAFEIGGETYWFPKNLVDDLKIKAKTNKVDITQLSFSMQEFMNPDVVEHLDYEILTNHFEHLKNKNHSIYVICSKNTKTNYEKIVKKLEEELANLGLKVENYYYLSQTFYNRDTDYISHKKVRLLLQHLIGYKTDDNKFTEEEISKYDRVYYYDDESSTINLAINSNSMFQTLLSNTDESIKERIKDVVKLHDNIIIVNKITWNKVNPFKTEEVVIKWSNLVKTFEAFSWINESEYKGTELPNQEMVEWFEFEFNQEPENMDGIESDMWSSEQQRDFIDEFRKELDGLSYNEVINVFNKAKNMSY